MESQCEDGMKETLKETHMHWRGIVSAPKAEWLIYQQLHIIPQVDK